MSAFTVTEHLMFGLGNDRYGVELSRVRELIDGQNVVTVASTAPCIRGVVRLRREALAVVDLRVKLGMPAAPLTHRSMIVVVRVEHGLSHVMTGLLVDEVFGVTPFAAAAVAPPPHLYSELRPPFVSGITKLGERWVVRLDPARLLTAEEQAELGYLTYQLRARVAAPNEVRSIASQGAGRAIGSDS